MFETSAFKDFADLEFILHFLGDFLNLFICYLVLNPGN